jgi:hypothetical protein
MKHIILFCVLLCTYTNLKAQGITDGSRVNGSFQVDGQYYMPDDALGINDSVIGGRKLGLNGFGKITYTLGNFTAGLRYEAYMTPILGFDPAQEGNGFPFFFVSYNSELIEVTAGSFYEQFGNGLVLRSYEEWTLGYDNAISGIKVVYKPFRGVSIKGVYGNQRYYWEKYERNKRGLVRGADAEVDLNEAIGSLQSSDFRVIVGASAVSKYQADNDPIYNLPENVGAFAGRLNLGWNRFNFMTEYAQKINDPSVMNNYIYKNGHAMLSSLSYSQKGLGVVLQLKRVDNMSFKSDRGISGNVLDIGFIPPINRTHSYSLAARYPYATQPNGEMGMQFQVNYKIPKGSLLGGKYGTGLAVNFSQVNDIKRTALNDTTPVGMPGTLGYSSGFFDVSDKILFRDLNIEVDKKFNASWKAVFQYMNQYFDIETLQGKAGKKPVQAHIVVADVTWRVNAVNSLRMEAQGMWTKEDKGDWAGLLLEYAIAPTWFFTLADQYNYGTPDADQRHHYYMASFGYTKQATRVALTYGRQPEGVICVGGVCRQVPAASGLTLSLTTNF